MGSLHNFEHFLGVKMKRKIVINIAESDIDTGFFSEDESGSDSLLSSLNPDLQPWQEV